MTGASASQHPPVVIREPMPRTHGQRSEYRGLLPCDRLQAPIKCCPLPQPPLGQTGSSTADRRQFPNISGTREALPQKPTLIVEADRVTEATRLPRPHRDGKVLSRRQLVGRPVPAEAPAPGHVGDRVVTMKLKRKAQALLVAADEAGDIACEPDILPVKMIR